MPSGATLLSKSAATLRGGLATLQRLSNDFPATFRRLCHATFQRLFDDFRSKEPTTPWRLSGDFPATLAPEGSATFPRALALVDPRIPDPSGYESASDLPRAAPWFQPPALSMARLPALTRPPCLGRAFPFRADRLPCRACARSAPAPRAPWIRFSGLLGLRCTVSGWSCPAAFYQL